MNYLWESGKIGKLEFFESLGEPGEPGVPGVCGINRDPVFGLLKLLVFINFDFDLDFYSTFYLVL